ncbi:hypothetical protein RDV89_01600 [Nocardioides zeae]|uniref:Uncharacterized protein n=1 Tax=Nocardioides imazamoxiresistens TaxID=3231893 RepID=A0ABU3PR88_9ACTN|nr:hypothetical protein [Nocardioides zeae]MDT9591744.1 hypothetical protein [Nocardioides zeae]
MPRPPILTMTRGQLAAFQIVVFTVVFGALQLLIADGPVVVTLLVAVVAGLLFGLGMYAMYPGIRSKAEEKERRKAERRAG